jgi:hypothetical protein
MKNQLETILLKWGNNPNDVKEMLNLYFDRFEKRTDLTVKQIAMAIRTIY